MKLLLQFGFVFGLTFGLAISPGQTQPLPVESLRQNALALEQQGKNAEAETAWQSLIKAQPSNPEAYAHLGLIEAREQHYKQAISFYRKALAIQPNVPSVRRDLGLALFKTGDLRGAIQEFGILLKSQPGDFQLVTLTGMAHYGVGEYKEAVPWLKDAAAVDKQNLPLRLALAHSCLWSKQYDCVMSTYHEILELNPNSAEADMIAAEALDEMKDNEGSTKLFREAVKANPKEPNVHFGLGYLLWTQKQYPEASSEFEAELANDPNHAQAMEYLADSYIQMSQIDHAQPLLEKAEKLDPKLQLVHLDLGIVYTNADRTQDALRELKAAAELDPKDVDVHWRLARLYRGLGRKDESKAEFDKASALTKERDDDNFKRIANAHSRPPSDAPSQPPASPASSQGPQR